VPLPEQLIVQKIAFLFLRYAFQQKNTKHNYKKNQEQKKHQEQELLFEWNNPQWASGFSS
ncbi:unnamed protein product, partial [Amoebophrya sp. A25]